MKKISDAKEGGQWQLLLKVFARCRGRIKDYDKEGYTDELFEQAERDLLTLAIDDFSDICVQDLNDYNEELKEFNIDLSRKEQNILSLGMIVHWIEPYIYNSDALRNAMSTKDFTFFSPANLLEKMTDLYKLSQENLRAEMNAYSFRMNDVSELNK